MISEKREAKASKTGPAGRWVVIAMVLLGAALAIVATLGHPRVRMRPHEPAMRLRIAVLPFENESGSPTLELLASDVTKAVTESLERAAGDRFEVVPREASLSYKDIALGIAQAAESFDCDYVIAGRIEATDTGIRTDLYLFKSGADPKFWPERLEWEASQIESIPEQVASRIQRALVDGDRPEGPAPR
jgi:TolB-like protein